MEMIIKYDEPGGARNIRTIELNRENEPVGGFREDAMQIAQDELGITYFELCEAITYMDADRLMAKKP